MANQKLVLEAEVRDNMTAHLKRMQKELAAIGKTPGMDAASGWMSKFSKEASGFVTSGGGAASVMNSLGIGGLLTGASLAGVVQQMTALGKKNADLKELSRQLQILPDDLNRIAKAGEYLRVPEDAMKAMVGSFAGNMPEFKRATGEMFKELSGIPGFLDNLYGKMKEENLGDAMLDGLKVAEQVFKSKGGPQQAKKLLEQMFPGHGEDALKLIGDGHFDEFIKKIEDMKKQIDPISPKMLESQQKFANSIIDLNHALENFEQGVGPKFLAGLTEIVHETKDFFDTLSAGSAKKNDRNSIGGVFGDGINVFKDFFTGNWGKSPPKQSGPSAERNTGGLGTGLRHRTSYEGQEGLLHNASFDASGQGASSGASFALQQVMAAGTKAGVLAAFREYAAMQSVEQASFAGPGTGLGNTGPGGGGGGRRHGAGPGPGPGGGVPLSNEKGGMNTKATADYIRQSAIARGIDPNVALKVYGHEGRGHYVGDEGSSFGPFQLHMGGISRKMPHAGLGDDFKRETGLDPRDPKNTRQEIDYALNHVRKKGWGAWMGAAAEHIHGFMGVGALPAGANTQISKDFSPLGGGQGGVTPAGAGGRALSIASGLLGSGPGETAKALGRHMTNGQWCADFVNGALEKAGIKGTGSSSADSFLHWGHKIAPKDAKAGDVLIKPGQHAAIATGHREFYNGQWYDETINGNWGHSRGKQEVMRGWIPENQLQGRRANGLDVPSPVQPAGGKAQVDIHVHTDKHGNPHVHKTGVRSDGVLETKLHTNRWNTMVKPSSIG